MIAYAIEQGLIYPEQDRVTMHKLARTMVDIDLAVTFCKQRRSVVQAGGHCGLWPLKLSDLFESVYTFEPDAENFYALTHNTASAANVFRFQAVLGSSHDRIGLERNHGINSGSHYVSGSGAIPTLTIDDLGLDDCDLIYLDIEGAESNAIKGARKTIETCRPVIAFEDKGHGARFGVATGELAGFLRASFGYEIVAEGKNDIIMAAA